MTSYWGNQTSRIFWTQASVHKIRVSEGRFFPNRRGLNLCLQERDLRIR